MSICTPAKPNWGRRYMSPWEKIEMKIAWVLPRSIVKWCFVRVVAHGTQGVYDNTNVPALTVMDALERWEPGPNSTQIVRLWMK